MGRATAVSQADLRALLAPTAPERGSHHGVETNDYGPLRRDIHLRRPQTDHEIGFIVAT